MKRGLLPALPALPALLQLVCRRFQQHTARVTAFVASAGGATSLAAEGGAALELRQSFLDAGLALDVAVLCPREELGEAAACALEALAGGGSASTNGSSSSSSSSSVEAACSGGADAAPSCTQSGSGAADVRSASPSLRLVWLQPVATAAESWQQLEAALELLEGGREASGGSAASRGQLRGATGGAGTHPSLPAQISRAPRQLDPLSRPRTALLAPRSGLPQPALCRWVAGRGALEPGSSCCCLPKPGLLLQGHLACCRHALPVVATSCLPRAVGSGTPFQPPLPLPASPPVQRRVAEPAGPPVERRDDAPMAAHLLVAGQAGNSGGSQPGARRCRRPRQRLLLRRGAAGASLAHAA